MRGCKLGEEGANRDSLSDGLQINGSNLVAFCETNMAATFLLFYVLNLFSSKRFSRYRLPGQLNHTVSGKTKVESSHAQ